MSILLLLSEEIKKLEQPKALFNLPWEEDNIWLWGIPIDYADYSDYDAAADRTDYANYDKGRYTFIWEISFFIRCFSVEKF